MLEFTSVGLQIYVSCSTTSLKFIDLMLMQFYSPTDGSDTTTATITTITNPNIIYDSQLPSSMKDHTISRIHEIEAPKPARPIPEEVKERSAPLFVSQPEPVEVFEGDWAKFVCRIKGVPRPRVLWIVNGKTVMNVSSYTTRIS